MTHPDHQRYGLSRELMRRAFDLMKAERLDLSLLYTVPNTVPFGFYRSLGYEDYLRVAYLRAESAVPAAGEGYALRELEADRPEVRALFERPQGDCWGHTPVTEELWRWRRLRRPEAFPVRLYTASPLSAVEPEASECRQNGQEKMAFALVTAPVRRGGDREWITLLSDVTGGVPPAGAAVRALLAPVPADTAVMVLCAETNRAKMRGLLRAGFRKTGEESAVILPLIERAVRRPPPQWYTITESVVGFYTGPGHQQFYSRRAGASRRCILNNTSSHSAPAGPYCLLGMILGGDVFRTLLEFLAGTVEKSPDRRRGRNIPYAMRDIGLSVLGVFFCQSPSLLAHQARMQQLRGINYATTLFDVQVLPTDNQIHTLLDAVDPQNLQAVYRSTLAYLQHQGVVERFRSFGNTLLLALDGSGYFRSEAIHCPCCSVARHADGRVVYTHAALMTAALTPRMSQVLALEPEFIAPQDGHQKQACESAAALRWIRRVGGRLSRLEVSLPGNDLYACTPIIREALDLELEYNIFVAEESSHQCSYEELESFAQLPKAIEVLEATQGHGAKRRKLAYRFVNGVPLTAEPSPVHVNWVQLVMRDDSGKITLRVEFVTSHEITAENVASLVEAGRCPWKIEDEDFNTLKTKGYHFEHNSGHGEKHLSQTLLSVNILAFLFDTVLELLDERSATLRAMLPRRDTFFHHLDTLVQYLPFANWQSLLKFMIRARRDGPGPPPQTFPIQF